MASPRGEPFQKPLDYHLELGAKLHALRPRGVLVVTSGNVVHHLGGANREMPDDGDDWAVRFEEAAKELVLAERPGAWSTS